MEYKLRSGPMVTDEELEADAEKWERGEWEGTSDPMRVTLPERGPDDLVVVSFRLPRSRVRAIEAATERTGVSESGFYRLTVDCELAEMSAPDEAKTA